MKSKCVKMATVARALGISRQAIYLKVKLKQVAVEVVDGTPMIPLSEMIRLKSLGVKKSRNGKSREKKK